eukprot:gene1391-2677_t
MEIVELDEKEKKYGTPLLRSVLYAVVKAALRKLAMSGRMSNELIDELVLGEVDVISDPPLPLGRMTFRKYPQRPYYSYIADSLYIWREIGYLPNTSDGRNSGAVELKQPLEKFRNMFSHIIDRIADDIQVGDNILPISCSTGFDMITKWFNLFNTESASQICKTTKQDISLSCYTTSSLNERIKFHMSKSIFNDFISLLENISPYGLLSFVGLRRTIGTIPVCPPDRCDLEVAFLHLHSTSGKNSCLTVGARALAKHAHRCSDKFWGTVTGTEFEKNTLASAKLKYILDNATWINCHVVSGDNNGSVIEVRIEEGYGARWRISDTVPSKVSFRGFLEPYMSDGHDAKWIH